MGKRRNKNLQLKYLVEQLKSQQLIGCSSELQNLWLKYKCLFEMSFKTIKKTAEIVIIANFIQILYYETIFKRVFTKLNENIEF